jgi:hypothetical protein
VSFKPTHVTNINENLLPSPASSSLSSLSPVHLSTKTIRPQAIPSQSLLPQYNESFAGWPAPHHQSWPSWPLVRRGQSTINGQTVWSNAPISNLFNNLSYRINNWATNFG